MYVPNEVYLYESLATSASPSWHMASRLMTVPHIDIFIVDYLVFLRGPASGGASAIVAGAQLTES